MVLETKRRYKPNVAYELLIDGKYHYFGSHCRKGPYIYGSEIKTNSGNRLTQSVLRGEITRKEYNERVVLLRVWEFDTPEDAYGKERCLIDLGKLLYGDCCYNIVRGNNKKPFYPDEVKEQFRLWAKNNREFLIECGKKGVQKNPAMSKSKPVCQYNGSDLVAVFPSISNAAKSTGIERRSIRRAVCKRYKTAGGFIWEYQTDMAI